MSQKVTRILLVCSAYDQFTIEEDGRIDMQIKTEYSELSLSQPPRFTRIDNGEEALELLASSEKFDIVITMFNIGEMSPFEFAKRMKQSYADIPLVLLTSFSHEITRRLRDEETSAIDYVFAWQGNADLILAVIKMIEDKRNAPNDMLEFGVQGILLVEDSVRFYSAYLPNLYKIVLTQTNISTQEVLNESQRKMRKRARPKVLLARSYEEALELFERYQHNLLGVISDISFARNQGDQELCERAGLELSTYITSRNSRLPILLQSSDLKFREEAKVVGADFICKNSKTLFLELAQFINEKLAFGAFKFIDPKTQKVYAVANDLAGLQNAVETLPDDLLLYYSSRNIYSKWMYARGMWSLADEIREVFVDSFSSNEELRSFLVQVITEYRRTIGQGVIAEFHPSTYNKYITFARCGSGSLGGKARGLAFLSSLIESNNLYNKWEKVRISIPRTLAISTGYFDEFMQINGIQDIVNNINDFSDSEILSEFVGSVLPEKLMEELKVFLSEVSRPLAVRSSSKLEDSHYQPFAGVYSTYMVPRSSNLDREVRLISRAIKSVYASVFFAASRSYIESTSNVVGEESMGVVIQEICGGEQNGLYYPTFSGVARSLNFYPIGDELPEDGICDLAMGLGKGVVEGGARITFSPAYPRHSLQLSSVESMLKDTQRSFYAMNCSLSAFKTNVDDGGNLEKIVVNKFRESRNLKYVASTWDMQNSRVMDNYLNQKGRPLITFAQILKYDTIPLAEILKRLLDIGQRAMKSPIEIEFAVDMDVPYGKPSVFKLLQIRPMVSNSRAERLDWSEVDVSGSILYSEKALGVGEITGVRHLVYVKMKSFDASRTEEIAQEVTEINRRMREMGEGYVLVGSGRWGSSDSWLGVPVKWGDIDNSRLIVECGLENFRVDPSQGTHFFQNLTSFGVGYMTVNPFMGDGIFDIERLDGMEAVIESELVRVVEIESPLYIFVDGSNGRGIVRFEQK